MGQDEQGEKYHLTWHMTPHPEGITREEIPDGHGACDALLLMASMIYPPDGGLSVNILGINGRDGAPLTSLEVFKVWTMIADDLSKSEDLGIGKRAICSSVMNVIREAMGIKLPVEDN